jgi:outer membrane lipoprotein-sorting protein
MERYFCSLIAAAILATMAMAGASAQSPGQSPGEAVLVNWLERQVQLNSWSADVTQVRQLKSIARPLAASGVIRVAQPQRFYWQLGDPARTIAVGTPTGLSIAYPRIRRMERYTYSDTANPALRQVLDLFEVGFPHSAAAFSGRYELVAANQIDSAWRFELQPRVPQARQLLERIYVEVNAADLELRATEFVFPDGSVMRNEFSNPQVNPPLDDTLFVLEPEADWEVTEPLAGKPLG